MPSHAPVEAGFREFLHLLNKPRISRWVFTKQDGGKLNVHSRETKFRRQLARLGMQNANLHTWRHTFANYLMMRTGNIRAVQMLLGHKSIGTIRQLRSIPT